MKNYETLLSYHLFAEVFLIPLEFGGRKTPVASGYSGQFFWQLDGESCTDWDACYFFEGGQVSPGERARCKILLSDQLLKHSGGHFPVGSQFAVREGIRIVAVGVIHSGLDTVV